jgi:hypothetical protein
MPNNDKFEEAVRIALRKAIKIVNEEAPPDAHINSKLVAAARLVHLLIEVDLDEE